MTSHDFCWENILRVKRFIGGNLEKVTENGANASLFYLDY